MITYVRLFVICPRMNVQKNGLDRSYFMIHLGRDIVVKQLYRSNNLYLFISINVETVKLQTE